MWEDGDILVNRKTGEFQELVVGKLIIYNVTDSGLHEVCSSNTVKHYEVCAAQYFRKATDREKFLYYIGVCNELEDR